ncbi:MAG: 4-(cytidine 5'-diphospho)-2-C-methyl-D-erythritol kinase [Oscillospiraceae bacterium]|nr:4-(cytidine 5'-diphospho)-2-C-methyl-D-erythritol kinase [Oscillospiraceae bacterium]
MIITDKVICKQMKAFAKVNISLDIISKMDDGYHYLKTIMQSVSLCDDITVRCEKGEGITVDTRSSYIPGDERNIAVKAAHVFFDYANIRDYKTHIEIDKHIPVCAGLGGGSADAACVLRMLNVMFDTRFEAEILEKLGREIGADVPFCIRGGTKLAQGRGDILQSLHPLKDCQIVICKPPFSCSTPELFARVNCGKIKKRPDTDGLCKALEDGDLKSVARRMYNVFEDIIPRKNTDIDDIKAALLDSGAMGAVMTGSGPSVIGLFDDRAHAKCAYDTLLKSYEDTFLTETIKEYL